MADEKVDNSLAEDIAAFVASKPWFLSRGVILPALGILGMIGGIVGVSLDEETKVAIADLADNVWAWVATGSGLLGLAGGIYGRIFATKKVTK